MTSALLSIGSLYPLCPGGIPMHANGNSFGWTPPGDVRPDMEPAFIRLVAGPGNELGQGVSWG